MGLKGIRLLLLLLVSCCCFLNLLQEMADKKQLSFKDTNGKIALEQVAQNQGSCKPWKYF